ncbi:MAG: FHA domain-containing protein [Propionibacteriaceae bacterium]|jgi:S-DNA-T family DNA segregation ATPase FtsK/SpoIIIE|nr:FHA domain-containing protein [Propionibacteriaceae bacterium]
MKLRVGFGENPTDERILSITTDATTTVGDVAAGLAASDPRRRDAAATVAPGAHTLRLTSPEDPSGRTLDPAATIQDAGVRSGMRVELAAAGDRFVGAGIDRGAAAAIVRVLTGPDAGREFGVPVGTSYVGRGQDADVRLRDPLVSGRHARLTVGTTIELTDLNSANGIIVGGEMVNRVTLTATDQVLLGDTVISIVPLHHGGAPAVSGSLVSFNRSPRVVARCDPHEVAGPTPPQLRQPTRFPYLAMVAPLIMGAVMFAATRQLMSIMFVCLSPILMVGNYVDQRLTARRLFRDQKEQFAAGLERAHETVRREHAIERSVRRSRCPSAAEALGAALTLNELLWTKRPENPDFLAIRLGVGDSPSVVSVKLPSTQNTDNESWSQLTELTETCAVLRDAPVMVNLRECGALGVAGPTEQASGVARGLLWQVAGTHAPSEVVVAALMSKNSRQGWEWLTWLPHTASAHSPLEGDHLADNQASATALLARLEELVDARLGAGKEGDPVAAGPRPPIEPGKAEEKTPSPITPAVILVVSGDTPVDRARLTRLVERGPDAGIHTLWVGSTVGSLPAACRAFIALPDDVHATDGAGRGEGPGSPEIANVATGANAAAEAAAAAGTLPTCPATTGQVRLSHHTYPVACDLVSVPLSIRAARALAPVVDAGAPIDDSSDLPRALSYLTLAGMEFADNPGFVAERWAQTFSITQRDPNVAPVRRKPGGLAALIGQSSQGAFTVDLRLQGPHALVGGTTGAGKSEFLQAWIMGMATRYSPDRVTFLFVDYKGGAAFADCVKLPHCVGLVTDLSPHLVRRALTSLRAELRHREHLLNRKKAKDLISLERTGDAETPPSLIIIVDEFAALVQEVPEFVDGVIDVAQRGRSLGLHLILATQRPAGVIKDNLRANTNIRVALRMADETDSDDVLGDKMAAHFDPSIPGRASAKTGPGRITPFQTGYVGGWTSDEPEAASIDIVEMDFGTVGTWEAPEDPDAAAQREAKDPGPTDIARMVATIDQASTDLALPTPRKPWLDPLAAVYDLAKLTGYRDDRHFVLGVLDDPDLQQQPVVYYEPDTDANLAILGAGGSGKSTALRTIAISAIFSTRNGGPVHIYGLDFGSNGLQMLEGLPHVGAIIAGDDEERVIRLLRTLRGIVDERALKYSKVNAASITDYRRLANAPAEPRILLLIDGMGAFREQYEFTSSTQWFNAFAQIAADGRPLGVHVVMTGDRPNAIPPSISSSVQKRIVLRLATEEDYLLMGVPRDILGAGSPPGRGILDDCEIQFAVWGADPNVAVQARQTAGLAAAARRRSDVVVAPGVVRLPETVELDTLPAADRNGWPVFGLADDTLGPIGIEPRGALLVAGPPSSGRTTALLAIAAALHRVGGRKLILFSQRRSRLEDALPWDEKARGDEDAMVLAQKLTEELNSDDVVSGRYAIIIDGVTDFSGGAADTALDGLIKAANRSEQFVVGEGESSTWANAWNLGKAFKAARRGLILVPGQMDADNLTGTSVGRFRASDFPPGRGFLIGGGRYRKVQVATA